MFVAEVSFFHKLQIECEIERILSVKIIMVKDWKYYVRYKLKGHGVMFSFFLDLILYKINFTLSLLYYSSHVTTERLMKKHLGKINHSVS